MTAAEGTLSKVANATTPLGLDSPIFSNPFTATNVGPAWPDYMIDAVLRNSCTSNARAREYRDMGHVQASDT
jgi:hypothetical protein